MKKYSICIILLALLGAVLSGALSFLHYYPDMGEALLCGGDVTGNCGAVARSEYAKLFGVPVAVYGFFFYLLILFTILIADYAAGTYYLFGFIVLFPLVVLSLAADVFLIILMVQHNQFCLLCALTYLVNLFLLLAFVLWHRKIKREGVGSFREAIKTLIPKKHDPPEKKAAACLYMMFVFLLLFSVVATSQILDIKTYSPTPTEDQVKRTVDYFYEAPVENLALPESRLVKGNVGAKVKIIVFTDFLCSACFEFYKIQKGLFSKFGDSISVAYYNYPHDRTCNSHVRDTTFPSSCVASKAMISAAALNIFDEYLNRHFSQHAAFEAGYNKDKAVVVVSKLADPNAFIKEIDSDSTGGILQRDIELANKFGVDSTPTLFINGRRMEGVGHPLIMEAIVNKELGGTPPNQAK